MKEIWKSIPMFENYLISNYGNVKNKERKKLMKVMKYCKGYTYVSLHSLMNRNKKFKIHFLVCQAFIGDRPKGKQINHINGLKDDNRVSNLEYVTCSENHYHAFRTGLRSGYFGSTNKMAKLTEEQVLEIREKFSTGKYFHKDLGKEYGVSSGCIGDIVNRKRWKHV